MLLPLRICVYAPVFVHLGLCSLVLQLLSVFWPVSIKCTHTYITDHNNVLIGWQSCVSEDVLHFYQCVLSLCPLIHWWTLHCTCSNWGKQNFISASICAPVFLACAWLVIGQREVQSWKRGSDASPNHTIRSKLLSLQSVTMSWNVLRFVTTYYKACHIISYKLLALQCVTMRYLPLITARLVPLFNHFGLFPKRSH